MSDSTRKRLQADVQVGTSSSMPVGVGIVFGGIFVVLGVVGVLASAGVFGVGFEAGRKAPHWVFAAFGIFSFCLGAFVCGMFVRTALAQRRRDRLMRENPTHAAFMDYPWNESGFVASPWPKTVRLLAWGLVIGVFLVPFNYFIFGEAWKVAMTLPESVGLWERMAKAGARIEVMPTVIICIFDIVVVCLFGGFVLALARALRFGSGRLTWARFPISPGEEAELRFELPRAIAWFEQAEIELRCIEEFWEESGSGKRRGRSLVHEQVWGDKWSISGGEYDAVSRTIAARFQIPPDAQSTSIAGMAPVFWRADLRVKMAGPDYVASFLVPVYAPQRKDFPVANEGVRI
jgi:hypothetical protein